MIAPTNATVPLGGAQTFTSTRAATWTIDEGSEAGDIDADGKFLAAATPGTYHVTATAKDDQKLIAKATVAVGPTALDIIYGTPGGAGDADGLGSAARLNQPYGITGDGSGNLFISDGGNR
jgi:hypothetical protein